MFLYVLHDFQSVNPIRLSLDRNKLRHAKLQIRKINLTFVSLLQEGTGYGNKLCSRRRLFPTTPEASKRLHDSYIHPRCDVTFTLRRIRYDVSALRIQNVSTLEI